MVYFSIQPTNLEQGDWYPTRVSIRWSNRIDVIFVNKICSLDGLLPIKKLPGLLKT